MCTKIQQTKMLVTCQRLGDWFLFGLVWPYSSNQKNIMKVGSKSLLLTCNSNKLWAYLYYIFLIRRESFCNGYLSLLYFWFWLSRRSQGDLSPNNQFSWSKCYWCAIIWTRCEWLKFITLWRGWPCMPSLYILGRWAWVAGRVSRSGQGRQADHTTARPNYSQCLLA